MDQLYEKVSFEISRLITRSYSTSFSSAVGLLPADLRKAIYSIYGFVRLADEIVDTFHAFDKPALLDKFEKDYDEAVASGISLNPVLHAFQLTVKKYRIGDELIRAFLKSMKTDLVKQEYLTEGELKEYIYGSADVVGLMCLRVFTRGDDRHYRELVAPAMRLGSAFQKVNFLRDLKSDTRQLGRSYFPQYNAATFDEQVKQVLVDDIETDFKAALEGIRKLPGDVRPAVMVAYSYYRALTGKISRTPASLLVSQRIRVTDGMKFLLLLRALAASKPGLSSLKPAQQ